MENKKLIKNRIILFFILLAISFSMMVFSQNKFSINFKSISYSVIYPFQFAGTRLITTTRDFFLSIKKNKSLEEELIKTKELIEKYERTQYEFEELKRENEKLRNLIGIQSSLEYETIIAEVVAKSPQNFYKTLIVNRGRESGVKKWMPVVAYQDDIKCTVGKVIDVESFSSRIQPLCEQSSYIGAMLKDSRYSGIVVGQSPISENCLLQYIDRRAEINYGDIVVTSGMGGIFPRGILIGEIISISKKRYGIYQEALVKPKVDLGRLEEVYIINKIVKEDYEKLLEEE